MIDFDMFWWKKKLKQLQQTYQIKPFHTKTIVFNSRIKHHKTKNLEDIFYWQNQQKTPL